MLLPGRLSWLRLLTFPLLLGVPHFTLGVPVTPLWVVLSALSSVLVLIAGRFPIAAATAQVGLLAMIATVSDLDIAPFKVVASVALFEAAYTRPLRAVALPAGLLAVGTVWITVVHRDDPGELIYKIVFVALAPMLLGAYLHAQHRAARDRHAAAVAAEARRRLAEREAFHLERAAIARELHDVVAHHIASIALRSAVARDVLPGLDPAVRTVLDEVHGTATLTLTEMRRLVALLRVSSTARSGPDTVEMLDPSELLPEVRLLVERVASLGLVVDLRVCGDVGRLDAGQAITVLRIIQESITNVLRHAGPSATAAVRIDVDPAEVLVTIDNSGSSGDEIDAVSRNSGFGLMGLTERVELLGGTLTAGPAEPGWRVTASFPPHRAGDRTDRSPAPAVPAGSATTTPGSAATVDVGGVGVGGVHR